MELINLAKERLAQKWDNSRLLPRKIKKRFRNHLKQRATDINKLEKQHGCK